MQHIAHHFHISTCIIRQEENVIKRCVIELVMMYLNASSLYILKEPSDSQSGCATPGICSNYWDKNF